MARRQSNGRDRPNRVGNPARRATALLDAGPLAPFQMRARPGMRALGRIVRIASEEEADLANDSMIAELEIGGDEALDTPLDAGTCPRPPCVVCRLDLDDEVLDRPITANSCYGPGATRVN